MNTNILRKLSRFFDWVLTGAAYLSGLIVVFLMLSISYEVLMRYCFARPTTWVIDFSGYAQYVSVLLGMAWVLKIDSHTRMDIVLNKLSPKTQNILNVITSLVSLATCAIFFWKGLSATWGAYQRGDFLYHEVEVPLAPLLVFIPLCFLLLSIQCGRDINKHLQALKSLNNVRRAPESTDMEMQ
jgi:TRAP-type C4-dicarboxylate transport system permease small subunit